MFVDLTPENLADETLCCIVRMKKAHPGVEAKRQWLAERLKEGHVFRKLEGRATVFMEYAPLEKAWVPILGENYLYIYCLWTEGENRGKGYGKALLESCLADAVWLTRQLHLVVEANGLWTTVEADASIEFAHWVGCSCDGFLRLSQINGTGG